MKRTHKAKAGSSSGNIDIKLVEVCCIEDIDCWCYKCLENQRIKKQKKEEEIKEIENNPIHIEVTDDEEDKVPNAQTIPSLWDEEPKNLGYTIDDYLNMNFDE